MQNVLLILAALIPVLIGILTVPIVNLLKRTVTWMDAFPAWAKQVTAALVAGGLTFLEGFLGIPLPDTLAAFQGSDVSLILSALISTAMAYGIHAGQKKAGG